ncbi:polysaccharide biosynthesis tyrosine autokinase [Jatrophihabitans sp. YIM 134969]
MNLRTYLRAIRKRWWWVVALTVAGGALGVAAVVAATPIYVSTVTFFVSTSPGGDGNNSAVSADQFAQLRATSYAQLLSSDRAAQAVIEQSGIDLGPKDVASRISGSVTLNTVLLTATITDDDQARALLIAQALADTFPKLVQQLDAPLTGSTETTVSLEPVSGPSVSSHAVSPKPTLYVGFGIIAGLVLGLFAAAVRDRFDTAVRSTDDLEGVTDAPLLSAVPEDNTAKVAPLVWGSRAVSQRAEAYRRLRTNLQFADVDNPVRVIVVTSAVAGEGKSSTSANLALSFADSGRRTVVVEADLRRPKLADYFEVDRSLGLTDVLAGRADLTHVLQPWGGTGLYILPSGSIPPNPSELLGSRNLRGLIETLREQFDVVIVDTPPVLPVTDAAVAAAAPGVDGVVFVMSYGQTKRAQVAAAISSLEAVGGRVLGLVLNSSPSKTKGYGSYSAYESGAGLTEVIDVNADQYATAPRSRVRAGVEGRPTRAESRALNGARSDGTESSAPSTPGVSAESEPPPR